MLCIIYTNDNLVCVSIQIILNMINIDDFKKVEMKVGKILSAEEIEGSDKLLKLSVDLGEENPRQVLSGIKKFVDMETLPGTLCGFITNLEPRMMMGLESQAMIMAAHTEDTFSLMKADPGTPPGSPLS